MNPLEKSGLGPGDINFKADSEFKEITDDNLVEMLRSGAEKPEAQEMLRAFCEQEEKKVEAMDSKEPAIEFNLRLGLIYARAGYIEEALESLDDAAHQAWQEKLEDLYWRIDDEFEKLKTADKKK